VATGLISGPVGGLNLTEELDGQRKLRRDGDTIVVLS
jgi:hypothetical protein